MGDSRHVRVHEYNTTAYAYDETQTNDDIRDGDVVIALHEGVVGILDQAWPFAITTEHGEFHGPPNKSAHKHRDGAFTASLDVALTEAYRLGFAVHPLNSPQVTPEEPEPEKPEREEVCSSCDGSGWVEVCHPSTDGLIGWDRCHARENHPVSLVKLEPWPPRQPHMEGCNGRDKILDACCPPF